MTHADATAAAFAAAAQAGGAVAAALRNVAASLPSSDDAPIRPTPRLGRGIVWSDTVAETEREQQERAEGSAR